MKKKLGRKKQEQIKREWQRIDARDGMSTRKKLEKLVQLSLKRDERKDEISKKIEDEVKVEGEDQAYIMRDFSYPLGSRFGRFELDEWLTIPGEQLAIISSDEEFLGVNPQKLLFFDTETTGLSGGTGTIPFLLGFGFFTEDRFNVKVFILNDLYQEEELLEAVDSFLEKGDFSAVVTYNGKGFDFPLMETRYILCRKRFPLLRLPHLDFLFPARTVWKHTYESCKLSYLGDVLLGISRSEDIDASHIPTLYFNYLRDRSFALMERVVEHNALDILGLAGLLLLCARYLQDASLTQDEGEILGSAVLYEKYGSLDRADELYRLVQESGGRHDVIALAAKRLSAIMKKRKLYDEAIALWQMLSNFNKDKHAARELSVHFEHREKDYAKALAFVQEGLESADLTERQRRDFEKRLHRLQKKLAALQDPDPEKE